MSQGHYTDNKSPAFMAATSYTSLGSVKPLKVDK